MMSDTISGFTTTQAMASRNGFFIALVVLLAVFAGTRACSTPAQLKQNVESVLSHFATDLARTTPGIYIQQFNSSSNAWHDLFTLRHNAFHTPASNNKVLTTAAVLTAFPPDHRMKTPIFIEKNPSGAPKICVRGVGDPSMTWASISQAAKMLNQNLGVSSVDRVFIDDSANQPTFPDGWPWGDLVFDYGAQPGPLVVDENTISFTVAPTTVGSPLSITYANPGDAIQKLINLDGTTTAKAGEGSGVDYEWRLGSDLVFVTGSLSAGSAPVKLKVAAVNPTQRWAKMFVSALEANGVKVSNSLSISPCGPSKSSSDASDASEVIEWHQIFTMESDTLGNMVNYTLQVSDNLMAEMWSRYLGNERPASGTSFHSATPRGVAAVAQILTKNLHVPAGSFRQRDGSGLDCANLVSPVALVETLKSMGRSSIGELYRSYLPSSAPGGMLYSRYIGTPAVGRVFAKTGYISLTSSLSGWVDHDKLFSIILDQSNTDSSLRKKIIDQIVVYIADLCPIQ